MHGYSVSFIVADDKGDEQKSNIVIYDEGASKGRLDPIRSAPDWVFQKAVELDANVYHLHGSELISIGLKLKSWARKIFLMPMKMCLSSYWVNLI